jgi:hypothetical protein
VSGHYGLDELDAALVEVAAHKVYGAIMVPHGT